MAVTLRSVADLQARHLAIFAQMQAKMAEEMREAGLDALHESIQLNAGAGGQPQGDSRRSWLAENRPYAYWHAAGRGAFAAPNPVGIITGELLTSIRLDYNATGGYFSAQTYSQGVDYARYVWAWNGTRTMVPRQVRQDAQAWAQGRMRQVSHNMVMFQRSLF